jgi:hypothetical protein
MEIDISHLPSPKNGRLIGKQSERRQEIPIAALRGDTEGIKSVWQTIVGCAARDDLAR